MVFLNIFFSKAYKNDYKSLLYGKVIAARGDQNNAADKRVALYFYPLNRFKQKYE